MTEIVQGGWNHHRYLSPTPFLTFALLASWSWTWPMLNFGVCQVSGCCGLRHQWKGGPHAVSPSGYNWQQAVCRSLSMVVLCLIPQCKHLIVFDRRYFREKAQWLLAVEVTLIFHLKTSGDRKELCVHWCCLVINRGLNKISASDVTVDFHPPPKLVLSDAFCFVSLAFAVSSVTCLPGTTLVMFY